MSPVNRMPTRAETGLAFGRKESDLQQGFALPPQPRSSYLELALKFYLVPEGPFLYWWDRFIIFLAYVNGLLVVFMSAFQVRSAVTLVLAYTIDAFFLVDFFLRFHIAFLHQGFWVTFPKEMAANFVSSWSFKLDLLAMIPLEAFAPLAQDDIAFGYYLVVLRCNRVLRTLRVFNWFYRQEKQLYSSLLMQVMKFLAYITITMHTCACIWYSLACPPYYANESFCHSDSWLSLLRIDRINITLGSMYTHCIYWTATTMTTTGYGDVRPGRDDERIFSAVCMILGTFLFGYVSGTIASMLSNLDSRRVMYRQKLDAIRDFMRDRKMDPGYRRRVLDWYDYAWERNKGIMINELFDDMPTSMKSEVSMHLNQDIVDKCPIFAKNSPSFRRFISMCLKFYLYTAQELLYRKDDACDEMYFLVRGRVDIYLSENDKRADTSLVDGSILAEVPMIYGSRHQHWAVAICNTDIYALTRSDLDKAFALFPEEKAVVLRAVEERRKQLDMILEQRRRRTKGFLDDQDLFEATRSFKSGKSIKSVKSALNDGDRVSSYGGYAVLEKHDPKAGEIVRELSMGRLEKNNPLKFGSQMRLSRNMSKGSRSDIRVNLRTKLSSSSSLHNAKQYDQQIHETKSQDVKVEIDQATPDQIPDDPEPQTQEELNTPSQDAPNSTERQ